MLVFSREFRKTLDLRIDISYLTAQGDSVKCKVKDAHEASVQVNVAWKQLCPHLG